jgi:hypothetical protein
MAADLFTKVLNGIIFVGVLRNVCGELVVEVFGYKLTVPKYLVITVVTCASTIWMGSYPACRAAVTYSALLTLTTTVIGSRMTLPGRMPPRHSFTRSPPSNLRERRAGELVSPDGATEASLAERGVRQRVRTAGSGDGLGRVLLLSEPRWLVAAGAG